MPARKVHDEQNLGIILCSLYLLFGISLLAMSFNLVQEEFISNVKNVAKVLGIIKEESDDEQECDAEDVYYADDYYEVEFDDFVG